MELIVQTLQDHHGNKDKCEHHLVDTLLSDFRSVIWESDPGIDSHLESIIRDKTIDYEVC